MSLQTKVKVVSVCYPLALEVGLYSATSETPNAPRDGEP